MKVFATLIALSLGFCEAKVFLRPGSKLTLNVRGGALLPPEHVANFAATAIAANSALVALAPGKACEAYGVTKSPLAEWLLENAGFAIVELAVMMILSLKGVSGPKTIAWGALSYLVSIVKNILNGTPQKFGMPVIGQYLLCAINTALAYSCLTGADWAGDFIKFYVGWCLLNGLLFVFDPAKSLTAWGYTAGATETELFIMKCLGYIVLSVAGMAASLGIFDLSPHKSIACAFVPTLFNCFNNIFQVCDQLGMPKAPHMAWLALSAAIIVSCGLD